MDTEIRVSTESLPWRTKFSRRSSHGSNLGHFDHESDVLLVVVLHFDLKPILHLDVNNTKFKKRTKYADIFICILHLGICSSVWRQNHQHLMMLADLRKKIYTSEALLLASKLSSLIKVDSLDTFTTLTCRPCL